MDENDQASFVQSLRDFADKHAAANPALGDLKTLNQHLTGLAREHLKVQAKLLPFAGYVDESGAVTVIQADGANETTALGILTQRLHALAEAGTIRAATICEVVERPYPAGGQLVPFVQFHSEHRNGLALLLGKPLDENVMMQGVPGAKGPAIGVYTKKVSPTIFIPLKP
jgi:hypothetical protein